jgi:ribosomal protein S18 acetylase RimI-like enzyme
VILRDTEDPRAIAALHLEAIRESGRQPSHDADAVVRRWLAVADRRFLVADLGGEVIAFIAYRLVDGRVRVTDLFVRPGHRRLGIARRLLERVERCGLLVSLTVAVGNLPAIALYVRAGFATVATRDGWHHLAKN